VLPPSCNQSIDRRDPHRSVGIKAPSTRRIHHCDGGIAEKVIEIRFPVAQPGVATVIRFTVFGGGTQTHVLPPGRNRWTVSQAETRSSVAIDYLKLGIHHIWTGTDHLLFVVCLIFIAGSWGRILTTITGFTVAHSLTLALSALGLVRLPVAAVEALIALSVVFLATEICKGRRDNLTWRYPISVSITFGLLHGLGFAAVLHEIGLPDNELLTGLLLFNVGVEVGQIIFAIGVITLFTVLCALARWMGRAGDFDLRLQQVIGAGAGCVAAFWMFERMATWLA
jgi:hydrogenase/urease accessory protein HupE